MDTCNALACNVLAQWFNFRIVQDMIAASIDWNFAPPTPPGFMRLVLS
jgi:hypothetical protein